MSQGRKTPPHPTLFVPASEAYQRLPRAHFYERLDALLDLGFVYELTAPLYAACGRPSLDPVVFFKCMLVGFFENVVHDTELAFRIADSLTLRRFLGYGLDERTPEESTLRKTRQRMPEEVFRAVFDRVLDTCREHGLLRGRAVGMDSTVVDANASMDSLRHRTLGCTYEEYILAVRRQDQPDATRADAVEADRGRSAKASNQVWVSATDPEARVMRHPDGHTHLSHRVDVTVDLETGVIVVAEAEAGDVSDQADCLLRVDEAAAALAERGLELVAVAADKGFHCQENLVGLAERELFVVLAAPGASRGEPGFRRDDFRYDPETDTLVCPAGRTLTRRGRGTTGSGKAGSQRYQAQGAECRACPHWGTCTSNLDGRAVNRPLREDLLAANRERCRSAEGRALARIRRQRGEGPFAHFKAHGGLRRFAGRGLDYARKKTLMAAAGWNLLRLLGGKGGGPDGPDGWHWPTIHPLGRLRAATGLPSVRERAPRLEMAVRSSPSRIRLRYAPTPHLSGVC